MYFVSVKLYWKYFLSEQMTTLVNGIQNISFDAFRRLPSNKPFKLCGRPRSKSLDCRKVSWAPTLTNTFVYENHENEQNERNDDAGDDNHHHD